MRIGELYCNMDGDAVHEADTFVYTVELSKQTDFGYNMVQTSHMTSKTWLPEVTSYIHGQRGDSYLKEMTLFAAPLEYLKEYDFFVVN